MPFFFLLWLASCRLPDPVRLPAAVSFVDYVITPDSLQFTVRKLIPGPIQLNISSHQDTLATLLDTFNPLVLTDSRPFIYLAVRHSLGDTSGIRGALKKSGTYGDPYAVLDTALVYAWPFPKGKEYKVIQGYHGSFSHNKDNSRYAIDFSLQVGDTVCAAQDGLVVSILQGNTLGGADRKYRPYANYITLYHADGLITQYVHLAPNSALVEVGNRVQKGQPLALSGKTGFTDGPHLHFNVYRPEFKGMKSAPIIFEQVAGEKLKKGMLVNH